MKDKEFEKLSEPLRKQKVAHLVLARIGGGISLSSIATGDDFYEFLQVLVDAQPLVLKIMQAVIDSRKHDRKPQPVLLN